MSIFVRVFDGTRRCCELDSLSHDPAVLRRFIANEKGFPSQELQLVHNGRPVHEDDLLCEDGTYYVVSGLKGGKGGFGAMLRMIGAQIEKTTNREACRDLSGRRMRDVNNEKKLQSWIEKKKEQEEERRRKRREKLDRMRSQPKHFFVDPSYDKQKEAVTESLEEAISTGIDMAGSSKNGASATTGVKRKAESSESDDDDDDDDDEDIAEFKRQCREMGIDFDEDDENSDDGDSAIEKADNKIDGVSGSENSKEESPQSSSSSPSSDPTAKSEDPEDKTPEASSSNPLLESLPPPENTASATKVAESGPVNLDDFSSAAELEELGLDRLKSALMDRGMKCGGTLKERGQRLYAVKGLEPSQIDPSLLAKPAKGKKVKRK